MDNVQWLRGVKSGSVFFTSTDRERMKAAADEIESLRAELSEARKRQHMRDLNYAALEAQNAEQAKVIDAYRRAIEKIDAIFES